MRGTASLLPPEPSVRPAVRRMAGLVVGNPRGPPVPSVPSASPAVTAVGLALAATGPGALLGSLLAARLPSRFGYGAVLVSAAVLGDGAMLWVARAARRFRDDGHRAPDGQLRVRGLRAVGERHGDGRRQAVTPDGMRGRAAATITFAGMGLTPLGSLLGGCLAEAWGLRTGLVVTAAGMLLSPALIASSPLARLGRTLPAPPPSATRSGPRTGPGLRRTGTEPVTHPARQPAPHPAPRKPVELDRSDQGG